MADEQVDFDDSDFAEALGTPIQPTFINRAPNPAYRPVLRPAGKRPPTSSAHVAPASRQSIQFKPHRPAPIQVYNQIKANFRAQALVQANREAKRSTPSAASPVIEVDDLDDEELEEVYDATEPADAAFIAQSQAQLEREREPSLSQYQRWKQAQDTRVHTQSVPSQAQRLPYHPRASEPNDQRSCNRVDAIRPAFSLPQRMTPTRDSEAVKVEERLNEALRRNEATDEELKRLCTELKEARVAAQTRAGEIAIIRANQAKKEQEVKERQAALEQLAQAQTSQFQARVDSALLERKQYAEENRFLNDELRKQSHQVQILQQITNLDRGSQSEHVVGNSIPVRVKESHRLRDGFEDNTRSVPPRTAKALSTRELKRKRELGTNGVAATTKAVDPSPALAVDLQESRTAEQYSSKVVRERGSKEQVQYRVINQILSYRSADSNLRAMELLSSFSLPSSKNCTFLATVLEKLPLLSTATEEEDGVIIELLRIFVDLLKSAVAEEYYRPVRVLVSIIRRCLVERPVVLIRHLGKDLAQLIEQMIKENAVPRLKPPYPTRDAHPDLDVPVLLELLHFISEASLGDAELVVQLWSTITLEMTLALLNTKQPVDDIVQWISTLGNSFQKESFGPISNDRHPPQADAQAHILTYLCHLLKTPPKTWRDGEPVGEDEISDIQHEILDLFGQACKSRNGGSSIASHPMVIARVLVIVSVQLNKMDEMRGDEPNCGEMLDLGVRILYHMLTKYEVARQAKLAVTPGGSHIYLVTMTRIAFSESLVLEESITDEIKDMAHALLESLVTPEDGDQLNELFATQEPRNQESQ